LSDTHAKGTNANEESRQKSTTWRAIERAGMREGKEEQGKKGGWRGRAEGARGEVKDRVTQSEVVTV